jgi:hypothetical protein
MFKLFKNIPSCLLACNVMQTGGSQLTVQRNILHRSELKIEATCFCKMSVDMVLCPRIWNT